MTSESPSAHVPAARRRPLPRDARKSSSPILVALLYLGAAMVTAVPLAQMGFATISGKVPSDTGLVTLLTTTLVGVPIFYATSIMIGRLQRARARLEKIQCRLEYKVAALAHAKGLLRDAHETLEDRVAERTRELEEARDAAMLANSTKSRFLANMSHELRTPLNAIIGFSEVLMMRNEIFKGDSEKQLEEYADSIHRSGHHLLSLVNDLLDLSCIEGGATKCEPVAHDFGEVINLACETMETLALSRDQRIEVIAQPSELVMADPRSMQQVLVNFLSNAVKYSPDGTTISVEAKAQGDDLVFSVTDQGQGMTPEQLEVATTPYACFAEAHVARGESSGLGLSIVVALVKAHRGSLSMESELGNGTVASVRLPGAILQGRRDHRAELMSA